VKTGWKRGYRAAVVAAGALLLAGGAVAVASASHGDKGKTKAAVAKKHVAKRLVRAGVHADVSLVRADASTDAFAVDRGKVTTSSATSLTLQRADGKSVTVSLTGTTVARGTVTVGKPVLVFSRNGVAFRVRAAGAGLAAPIASAVGMQKSPIVHLQVSFVRADGSTHTASLDRGQVTAASSTSLMIKRADGQSVTFTLGASVRVRGHLVVGGKALVVSRDGAVVRVLARGGTVTG
jgi:hypothetical protein